MPSAKDVLLGLATLLTLGHFITAAIIAADAVNRRDTWQLAAHGYERRQVDIGSILGPAMAAGGSAPAGPKNSDTEIGACGLRGV